MVIHLPFSVLLRLLQICILVAGCIQTGCARQDRSIAQSARQQSKALTSNTSLIAEVRRAAYPLNGNTRDYDPLMQLIGDARFVLLGEATHGTREFYRERARITHRLIEEKGFTTVVLEADWPDAYRVNRYIRGVSNDETAEQALSNFTRFPRWMWRNREVRDLVQWLRVHNDKQAAGAPGVRLYGMDLYSLFDSADAVIKYLQEVDASAAERARARYRCFERFRKGDPQSYGAAVTSGSARSCGGAAQEQFQELQQRLAEAARQADRQPDDELLSAYQNARVVKNGESYYRTIYGADGSSWNLRDRHMAETLNELSTYLDSHSGAKAKIVVWAHNTHQGDARVTEMGEQGELNVGQLMRQGHDGRTVLVGFTTYTGTVMAASEWGRPGERMNVRPSIPGSYGELFHETGVPNFLLLLRDGGRLEEELARPRLERAIGVVYLPRTERQSHYFKARLSKQFDAVIHFDVTGAVTPLDP